MPVRRAVALCGVVAAFWMVSSPAGAAVANVSLENVSFVPGSVEIRVGDSVVWTHNDSFEHTITATPEQEESFDFPEGCGPLTGGCMQQGEIFTHSFDQTGVFTYFCRIHCPDGRCPASGMRGEVVVLPPATPTPTPTATPPEETAPAAPIETPEPAPTPEPTPTPTPAPLPTFEPVPFTSPLALDPPVNEARETLLPVAGVTSAVATLFGLLALWRFSPGYYRRST